MEYLKYQVIKNGIFVPKGLISRQDIVYDKNNEIVLESCVLRGHKKSENVTNPPKYLPTEIEERIESIDEQLLFLGQFMREHYGHSLTEGVSRYWYLLDHSIKNWKIPTSSNPFTMKRLIKSILMPSSAHCKKAMLAFNINYRDILCTQKPVRANRIIVPQCSMYNRHKIYQKHLDVTIKIAKNIISPIKIKQDQTPVYLSRTKLNRSMKGHQGEKSVEAYCKKLGCNIVYPEQLSLKQQIVLINTHDIFIGCIGSAFHSLLFRFVDRKATNIYLTEESNNPNYKLIDALMHNESYYIRCISLATGNTKDRVVDSEKAISNLSNILQRIKVKAKDTRSRSWKHTLTGYGSKGKNA